MKKLVFFNCFHNGDLHLSRAFIADLVNILPYQEIEYEHSNALKILKDIPKLKSKPLTNFKVGIGLPDAIIETDECIFVNTWIGQSNMRYVYTYGGCTYDAYYKMFSDIYEKLNVLEFLKEKEYYLPKIDYSYYNNIDNIKDFMLNKNKNVFIANQNVNSGQIENFNFDNSIITLANIFKDVNFFITGKTPYLSNFKTENMHFTKDIINIDENDLNENSFISTFCDLIIGRSSGPYCFCQTHENYLNNNKTYICFDNTITNAFWVLLSDNFIKAKTYAYKFHGEQHLVQTLYNHIKQSFNIG